MFWLRRLRQTESDNSAWALSYGDLMSLLLAVFVMIAAMSELKAGERFRTVNAAVRGAFGYQPEVEGRKPDATTRRPSLIERLTRVGLPPASGNMADDGQEEALLARCQVEREGDEVVVTVPADLAFEAHSGQLTTAGRALMVRLADCLVGGRTRLEVRGYRHEQTLPSDAPFRDSMDLAYARARAVVDELSSEGVLRDRLTLTVPGGADLSEGNRHAERSESENGIEIIVHAAMAAGT